MYRRQTPRVAGEGDRATDADVLSVEPGDIAMEDVEGDRARSSPGEQSRWRRVYQHRGVALVIFAAFLASAQNILARVILEEMHVMQLSFLRFSCQLLFPIPFLISEGESIRPGSCAEIALLLVRSVAGTVGLVLLFYAILFTRIGDATAVVYASPVFVGVGARIWLKEAFDILDALLVVVVIGGVFLISQPPFLFGSDGDGENVSSKQLIGVGLAFICCLVWALNMLLMRRLGQLKVSAWKMVFWYGLIAVFGTAVFSTALSAWSLGSCYKVSLVRCATVALGICNFLAQAMISYSLSLERSVFVSVLRTNEVVFSYILEFLIFGLSPELWVIVGVVLVMGASITASLKKLWISKRKGIARRNSTIPSAD